MGVIAVVMAAAKHRLHCIAASLVRNPNLTVGVFDSAKLID
jgi:hypothetical protein